ncbi:hypothetical protein A5756_18270 [Mycobacterium sp. 852002-53434_SCH5985345]|uniref:hypothetical protein n=1 Tax=unclassified Mycobacterium TaxID=2642494 RepID=UPI0007FCB1B4|nr:MULTISPECIES: hypothetical protein [unclassified Mycobacterium]OBF51775.1 hypothetical protein A5756_18270 [Mycobacterium sp. 852002-53434_SCH5985345]OBF72098.1 hypothetical protein A5750_18315 [Mycobacterium sp. 852002-51613_SCH5001154]OBF94654.1 hypothetical protein A5773_15575 [Mycobacterium sp. 852014-52450_SCH5900713]
MKRLITGFAVVGSALTFLPGPVAGAASNTATTLFPLDGPNQLETRTILNCFKSDGHCDFTAGADMLTPDGVTGFPHELWARQTTEIRSSNRLAYLDAHATGQYERVMKSMGSDEITTVYFGEGPPDKYQTTGRIDSTDWQTGQPKTDNNVIVCTHIQVVYPGVNITSPSTCAQTTFS